MQDREELTTKAYAKKLAGIVTIIFWIACIIIGIAISLEEKAAAITLLLCFGSLAPIAVWYIICLIREKHSGVNNQPRMFFTPIKWGALFFLICSALLISADVYRKQRLASKIDDLISNSKPEIKALYKKYGLEPTE